MFFVVPDLGPNCLQRLSADDTSMQRVYFPMIIVFLQEHLNAFKDISVTCAFNVLLP